MRTKIFALGFFDGVHLGHRALLESCVTLAQTLGASPAAITFDRHPQALFTATPPALLNANADRKLLLRDYGIREILELQVTERVMSTSWQDFLEDLLQAGAAGFVCGDDFRFGYKGQGNGEKLQAFCAQRDLPCVIVPEQSMDGVRISSTHIRKLIEAGDMETASKFLGHDHILSGEVVPGRRIGRTIGIPTANVLIPDGVVIPKRGVYATECLVDGNRYRAVTNIGSRPTVDGHQTRAESWLMDFDGDLYGKQMTIFFRKFLRPEEKFPSLEELKRQIRLDASAARETLR